MSRTFTEFSKFRETDKSLPPANEVCKGYVFTRVCHSVHRVGAGGIPTCTTAHMTKHYISRSQLVAGQHTANIKCMIG